MNFRNYQAALRCELQALKTRGYVHNDTLELLHGTFTIERPWERYLFWPARKYNPFVIVAETLWTLAGRDNAYWLLRYVPKAYRWVDNEAEGIWHGAYGPRLFCWVSQDDDPSQPTDQVDGVIQLLSRDKGSRQAVISLWDPGYDLNTEFKNIPCNNWLSFQNRAGMLHMMVGVRSLDMIWGSAGDTFLWSVLQELIADRLNVSVGPATYCVSSEHYYSRHIDMVDSMLRQQVLGLNEFYDRNIHVPLSCDYDMLHIHISRIMELEYTMRSDYTHKRVYDAEIWGLDLPAVLHDWTCMLAAYNTYLNGGEPKVIQSYLNMMVAADAKTASGLYFTNIGVFPSMHKSTTWFQFVEVE